MHDENPFDIEYKDDGDARIIYLPEEVDIRTHIPVKGRIIELMKDTENHIVFDMNKTTFIDSSGISIIIMVYNLLSNENRKVYIINASKRIKSTIKMTNLDMFIDFK